MGHVGRRQTITIHLAHISSNAVGSVFDSLYPWNIDRCRTTDASARKGGLAPVASVDVLSDRATQIRFSLLTPFSPLLSLLVDQATA